MLFSEDVCRQVCCSRKVLEVKWFESVTCERGPMTGWRVVSDEIKILARSISSRYHRCIIRF